MCMTGTFATRGAQVLNTEALLSLDVINTAIIYTCAHVIIALRHPTVTKGDS